MNILIMILAIIVSATLYRMGGSGNYPRWMRTALIPAVATAYAFFLGVRSWWLVLHFASLIGAISTYWDEVFGYDNFWMHGFMCGLSGLFICLATGHWARFLLRCIIIAVWSGVWSKIWKWDVAEEAGRLLPLIPTYLMII